MTSATLHRASFAAFGGKVEVASDDAADSDRTRQLFEQWERDLSRFRSDSALCRLNRAGRLERAPDPLLDAIEAGLEAARFSDGLVDLTVLPELEAAGYDRTFEDVVTGTRREPARPALRGRGIRRQAATVELSPGTRIDVGGVAKGLAVDRAIARLRGERVLVNAGGDLRVRGGGWTADVRVLRECAHPADAVLAIDDGALATSGVTHRRWSTTSGQAHHLIDPRSGLPAQSPWLTATVWSPTCLQAEIAAKTAIIAGPEGAAWLDRRGIAARLVGTDGSVTLTGPWAA